MSAGLAPGPAAGPPPAPPADLPAVTVAVCTRDRPAELADCLDALGRLDYPRLELLVVDNAPSDSAAAVVVSAHRGVRYVREARPGLAWARNRAIAEAGGEILAFTDDDVIVDRAWVRALAAAFASDPAVAAVTGRVAPYELETEAQRLFERYRGFGRGTAPRRVPGSPRRAARRHGAAGAYGTGANMAFRREVFAAVGPFDPALGAGTAAQGGEDLEMFFRLLKAGYTLAYEPAALVWHRHRRTPAELERQIRGHGISFGAYLARTAAVYPDEAWGLARLGLRWIAKLLYRTLVPRGRPAAPLRRLAWAELRGVLAGPAAYRTARRAAARLLPTPRTEAGRDSRPSAAPCP